MLKNILEKLKPVGEILLPVFHFITKKPVKSILIFVSLLFFFNAFFGDYGLTRRFSLEYEKKRLVSEIAKEKELQTDLKKRAIRLEKDHKLIEQIAREKYGMVKPGETLYKIQVVE